jgi:hypothetical protein
VPQTHDIRLAGPWQQSLPDQQASERVKLPYSVSVGPPERLSRNFHRPTGLSADAQVVLLIHVEGKLAAATLNGSAVELGPADVHSTTATQQQLVSTDLVERLQQFNEFSLTLETESTPATLKSVVLRIIEPDAD